MSDEAGAGILSQQGATNAPPAVPPAEVLPPGANQVFRLLDRGPMLWGLPVKVAGLIMGCTSLGFFVIKPLLGWKGAAPLLVLGFLSWAVLGFVNAQDKTFIPMLMLRFTVKLFPRVTSYTRGSRRLVLED